MSDLSSKPSRSAGDDPDEPETTHAGTEIHVNAATAKPRIWPLFALSLVELVLVAGLQGAVAGVLLTTRAEGKSIQEAAKNLPARLMEPPIFVLMLVISALTMLSCAFLFGSISAQHLGCSISDRLGLRWPSISAKSFVCLLLGSVPVLLVSVGVVVMIDKIIPADDSVLALYKNISSGWAVVLIVSIGVLPGFSEELFFRGFFQRRMLQRFRPSVAIGLTSLVFGLFHVTPHGIALATIIGVWLGVIAWRTNSILPSACCHAFINSGWNVYQVGRFQWGLPEIPPIWFSLAGGLVVLVAFAWSVRILAQSNLSSH